MCECKDCGQVKVRNYTKKLANGRLVYTAEDGRYWSGKVCPDCHNKRRMRLYHEAKPSHPPRKAGYSYVSSKTKLRACQSCQTPTPNYYKCESCHLQHRKRNPDLYDGSYDESMFGIHTGSELSTFSRGAGFRY